jgi:4-hydroxybenzoate polyprenyltransferase
VGGARAPWRGWSRLKLSTAFRLGRVSNLPTVSSNVLAGLALAGARDLQLGTIAVACCAASLLYVGGMFLNDAFDAEIDARERPERPIPSGLVRRGEVFGYGAAFCSSGVVLATLLSLGSGLLALATAATIVAYDVVHKRTRFAPLLMGLCRVGVYWLAALVVLSPDLGRVALGSAVLCAYVLALTYAAARENSTALVRIGPLVGLYAPVLVIGPRLDSVLGFFCLLVFVLWTARNNLLVRTRLPARIRVGIGGLIAGISLLDALWLAATGAPAVLTLFALAAFLVTLTFQRFVAGT